MSDLNWQYDPEQNRWFIRDLEYPTYVWGIHGDDWVYHNPDMMAAIERSLDAMTEFPDADKILQGLTHD